MSVLVVEDDEAMAAVLQAWLRVDRRFVRVEQVATVAAVRARVAGETPDIVVLDYTLPDGTAADVLSALDEMESPPAAVLYSSHPDVAALGDALGCQASVRKGDWAELADRLLALAAGVTR